MLIKLSAEEEAMRHYSSSYSSSFPASHESGACNHRCPEHVSSISLCRGRTHLHHHHHVGVLWKRATVLGDEGEWSCCCSYALPPEPYLLACSCFCFCLLVVVCVRVVGLSPPTWSKGEGQLSVQTPPFSASLPHFMMLSCCSFLALTLKKG